MSQTIDCVDRIICVWECRSIDGRQVTRVIHPAYPDDARYVHEYQRIVYRGPASGYETGAHKHL